jgi:hypothetical protein
MLAKLHIPAQPKTVSERPAAAPRHSRESGNLRFNAAAQEDVPLSRQWREEVVQQILLS